MEPKDFNQCVDIYSDGIYRFILKNIKDEDKANDIVQDTFEKLWNNRNKIDHEKIKSWLFTTAYHSMIDTIRKDKRLVKMDNINKKEHTHNNQYSDLQEILHKAIDKLPVDQKSALLLRDYEGYSYKEIEQITGLTEAQVKVYIYRARLFLKEYLVSIEAVA